MQCHAAQKCITLHWNASFQSLVLSRFSEFFLWRYEEVQTHRCHHQPFTHAVSCTITTIQEPYWSSSGIWQEKRKVCKNVLYELFRNFSAFLPTIQTILFFPIQTKNIILCPHPDPWRLSWKVVYIMCYQNLYIAPHDCYQLSCNHNVMIRHRSYWFNMSLLKVRSNINNFCKYFW